MTLKKGIVTALATGALFVSTLAPLALADSSVAIDGNGAVSQNSVSLNQNTSTNVTQNNNANISNNVTTSSNTGDNHADFNTGGSTAISTGNASNTTTIMTQANANIADLGGCTTCSANGNAGQVSAIGNGAFSNNTANTNNTSSATLTQNNTANISNWVNSQASTGNNSASFNTGGNTTVLTGNASNNTTISNMANANVASLPSMGSNGFGSAIIAGNGAESDNAVTLDNGNTTNVSQNNWANIMNNVVTGAQTGNNKAAFNTGGGVLLATGSTSSNTTIGNWANFNAANMAACGCLTAGNGTVTLFGNGAFSNNTVSDNLGNSVTAAQNNAATITNTLRDSLHGNGTGHNSLWGNTSDNGGTSFLLTGGTNNTTNLDTSANVNSVSNGSGFNLGGMNVHVLFDMGSLLNQLGL